MCGATQTVSVATEGATPTIVTVTGMAKGDSCSFKIKSSCGSPAFALKSDATAKDAKVAISFIEFQDDKVTTGTPSIGSTVIVDRPITPPVAEMPIRK